LYGNIKVVSRDGTASDFIRGVLNYQPNGQFPGSGEQGLTGIVVDPVSGDVFASMLYASSPGGPTYPKVVRFKSSHGGRVSGSSTTILDMAGESMRESHQISILSVGPDGKLYVHVGDGFDSSTALNLDSFRGKILRLNLDGTPATDNPFYSASNGINGRDYVFAYGLRNPFGGAWRGRRRGRARRCRILSPVGTGRPRIACGRVQSGP
jgi:glucose/arabinose dehydrogenase